MNMDDKQLRQMLSDNHWTLGEALRIVHLKTGFAIDQKTVTKQIKRCGRLSAPLSAVFVLVAKLVQSETVYTRLRDLNIGRELALIAEINQLKGVLNAKT